MDKSNMGLYEVNRKLKCTKCGHIGAIRSYGTLYPKGLGDEAKGILSLQEYKDKQFFSHTMGFGGTIPWECTNCGNVGLEDFDGLEGYRKTFKKIE